MASTNKVGKAIVESLVPVAVNFAPNMAGSALRKILALAIDGASKMPSAKETAARQLERQGSADEAIDSLIQQHVGLAGAQGFVTNVGGLVTTVVSLPANLAGIAVVQARMVACIAHLRGYDIDNAKVRTAIAMCLIGEHLDKALGESELPTHPMVVATAPMFDPELDRRISDRVASELIAQVTGKRMVVAMTKKVPVVGGGVGAVFDGWGTYQIGRYARQELLTRRHQ